MLEWQIKTLEQLTPLELFKYLKLRQDVFVVEQECAYPDIDDTDLKSKHLLGWQGKNLVACARLIPAGITYDYASVGRIATSLNQRGEGLGRELVQVCLDKMQSLFPDQTVKIGAQQRLESFYQSFGFKTASKMYIEDGIPHIDMLLEK